MPFLQARKVAKEYSGHVALTGLDLDLEQGHIHGLLGPNGAGKTTFIRIVNQITRPDSGEILIDGRPLQPDDVNIIGYMPEERGLYKKMKVGEMAVFLAQLKGLKRQDATQRLKKWFEKFQIGEWWNKKVEELSKGMQQKIQFIVTVLHEPKLFIFDEPFSGLDPVNARLLMDEILQLKTNGATILFSTHNMTSVEEVCDEITLINKSKAVLNGNVADVKERFKDNIYGITLRGTAEGLQALPQNIEIVSHTERNGTVEARIKPRENMPTTQIIKDIIGQVELTKFEEIYPTMSEIFIKIVTNKEA